MINGKKKSIHGVFLSENLEIPKLVEIDLNIEFQTMFLPNTEPFIGQGESQNYMQMNPFSKKPLKDTLVFIFRDNFMNDGSKVNKNIKRMMTGKNDYPWAGPVVVVKMLGASVEHNLYGDVNVDDFKDIVDYFCWYGKEEDSRFNSTFEELGKLGFQHFKL